MNTEKQRRQSQEKGRSDAQRTFFVMSSEVETISNYCQTESKRFLDFARNDKKVMRGIEQDRDRETRK